MTTTGVLRSYDNYCGANFIDQKVLELNLQLLFLIMPIFYCTTSTRCNTHSVVVICAPPSCVLPCTRSVDHWVMGSCLYIYPK